MKLSTHFDLAELTVSEYAARAGVSNQPTPAALANLKRLALFMERVRDTLGQPINISSGYRSPLVNAAIGGVLTSQHCKGLACDFRSPYGSPLTVASRLARTDLPFDQLILEYGSWVHISIPAEGVTPRRQVLHIQSKGKYVQGLPKGKPRKS